MPKYKVKPESWGICEPASPKDDKHYPTIYFPVSKEMLASLSPGEEIKVTFTGKVKGTELRENEGDKNNKAEVRMEIYEVEAYAEGEYEKLAKDDDE